MLVKFFLLPQNGTFRFKFLKSLSFKIRHKPVGRVYDNTAGEFKHKCNFDVELTIDALDGLEGFDVFVLLSGNGDFIKLIRYLRVLSSIAVDVCVQRLCSWANRASRISLSRSCRKANMVKS
ncbi:MAG: NYN domain-containing protein [Desulfobacterales bacterium]|nr:NYN domain-containing protein [Desulfobacterales bacterium]